MQNLVRVLVFIAALSIVTLGLLGGAAGIMFSLLSNDVDRLAMVTFSTSFVSLTAGLGLVLAWQAWQAIQGHPSTVFRPKRVWPMVLAFCLAVAIGHAVLVLGPVPLLTFPPFHVAAAALPPLILVAIVGRGLGGVSLWRDVVLQLASGAFLATCLAFALEAVALLSMLTAALAGAAIRPGGVELLQTLSAYLQDPTWLQQPTNLAPVLSSPALLVAALAVVAAVIPLIEEAVKTVGVGLMSYRRPSLSQAFLWGMAGGAGFALTEALLNTATGLEAWAPVITLRVGATVLHCLTGALMGLAWYAVLRGRRWGCGFGLFGLSIGIHGIWNALSAGITFLALVTVETDVTVAEQTMAGWSVVASVGLMVILILTTSLSLAALTWYVRRRSSTLPPQDSIVGQPAADALSAQPSSGEEC
jgi:hypothetical protein